MNKNDNELLAPRCVQCFSECPNGLEMHSYLIVCQNPACPNYGLFQAGDYLMDEMNKQFPFIS